MTLIGRHKRIISLEMTRLGLKWKIREMNRSARFRLFFSRYHACFMKLTMPMDYVVAAAKLVLMHLAIELLTDPRDVLSYQQYFYDLNFICIHSILVSYHQQRNSQRCRRLLCVSLCRQDYYKNRAQIRTKFSVNTLEFGPLTNGVDFKKTVLTTKQRDKIKSLTYD